MNLLKDVVPSQDKQKELAQRLQEGKFTLRDMYEQFQNMLKMGPLGKGSHFVCLLQQALAHTNFLP